MSVLSDSQIQNLAVELHQSEKSRVQIEHFSKRYPGMTIEDGYRINRAWMQIKFAEGRTMIGHKIGLTSRAMQVSSQIDEPDYGTLLDDMLYTCTPGQVLDIPHKNFIAPRVEVELAFILKKELRGPQCDGAAGAGRHRVRDARDRDHRFAHRAVRPPHQGHAQGV
jgi:2-oxo-hept-3-ene-1,7-dioate hydratase